MVEDYRRKWIQQERVNVLTGKKEKRKFRVIVPRKGRMYREIISNGKKTKEFLDWIMEVWKMIKEKILRKSEKAFYKKAKPSRPKLKGQWWKGRMPEKPL